MGRIEYCGARQKVHRISYPPQRTAEAASRQRCSGENPSHPVTPLKLAAPKREELRAVCGCGWGAEHSTYLESKESKEHFAQPPRPDRTSSARHSGSFSHYSSVFRHPFFSSHAVGSVVHESWREKEPLVEESEPGFFTLSAFGSSGVDRKGATIALLRARQTLMLPLSPHCDIPRISFDALFRRTFHFQFTLPAQFLKLVFY